MSGSDIRDILELGKRSDVPQQRKTKPAIEKRPEGFNREIFSLTGGITPEAFSQPTYKAKFNLKKKATPWVLQSFQNPARTDELELQHWIKGSEANRKGYPFARFDKQAGILQYTDKDYDKHLKDPTWTKDETDYLMDLCKRYELRFPVIADRYQYDPHRLRSIDDIKERYYGIQHTLHKIQGKPVPPVFDKTKELERKHALGVLFHRSKESQEEEAELLVQVNRIEQNQNQLAKERENLQELLQQHHLSTIPSNKKASNNVDFSKEKKRKRKATSDNKDINMDEIEAEKIGKMSSGVYVRSQKLPILKSSLQPKVSKVLNELSIGTRPVMPTALVCDRFEKLENSIVTLFELKKVVDKMEIEHRITKEQV
ncbi:uncharacterized protein BX664DRAFT_335822 [Halteromyces radiatus]|uniref:uncharacterized protein n=1 Tax=Halteromyces radiatus TaxID=101107 RepID=UPI00221FEB6E|nr:uncharacterized protein BX664DRAFT_335822 [Halteromyces radiatus]KAI8086449.1 hypothetical protein BX664DRAFT_335822 [Halteromyces radiatus]